MERFGKASGAWVSLGRSASAANPGGLPGSRCRTSLRSSWLRVKLLHGIPGRAKALRELSKGDSTAARFNHTKLQLEVAALSLPLGWRPRLEVLEWRAPVDVVLDTDHSGPLKVEVCVVPIGDRTAEAMARNRALVSPETELYAIGQDVSITGHLS